jgi:thiamine biosynthesis lipoprotein
VPDTQHLPVTQSAARIVAAGLPNLVVGVLALLASACGDPALRLVELSGTTMGTIYNVKLVGMPAELEKKTLHARIDEKLIAINAQMSTYDRESELSRFNTSRSTDWVETSTDLAAVIRMLEDLGVERDNILLDDFGA